MQKLTLIALALLYCTSALSQASVEDLKVRARTENLKDLVIGYDQKTDRTVIITKPVELLGNGFVLTQRTDLEPMRALTPLPQMLFITIGYEGHGDGLEATPDHLTIAFITNTRGWRFLNGDDSLYIVCDEKRMPVRSS